MNDEQYVEASRKLAERLLQREGTVADQLAYGFRVCTGRSPNEPEQAVLTRIHSEQLSHFTAQPEAATKLLAIGAATRLDVLPPAEHAAMTMMANLLLNLDETITRE